MTLQNEANWGGIIVGLILGFLVGFLVVRNMQSSEILVSPINTPTVTRSMGVTTVPTETPTNMPTSTVSATPTI